MNFVPFFLSHFFLFHLGPIFDFVYTQYSRNIKLCKIYEEKVNKRAKNLVPKRKKLSTGKVIITISKYDIQKYNISDRDTI